jgi:ceramide glucosyltransferase
MQDSAPLMAQHFAQVPDALIGLIDQNQGIRICCSMGCGNTGVAVKIIHESQSNFYALLRRRSCPWTDHSRWRNDCASLFAGCLVVIAAHPGLIWCGIALASLPMMYSIAALLAVRMRILSSRSAADGSPPATVSSPPVTMLKPLCGAEHEIYQCLRSFCDQDYPRFQVVFGVSDSDDPAIAVVHRLQREFAHIDIKLAIDRRQHGSSPKVSNLINMMCLAQHDYLVLSDSDVRVGRDYLSKVVAPLLDPSVGIVTCAYRGWQRPGLWSLLGSLFINEWFTPSVLVAAMSGSRAFAFGATIAMRRKVLADIGGFMSIANQLADDYRLGELTRRMGLRTVLSDVVVETCVDERNLGELVRHELRWLRTIRAVRPMGYALSFVTYGVPVAALGSLLAAGAAAAVAMLGITAAARVMLHLTVRKPGTALSHMLVLPIRDTLSFALWGWGFVTRRVHWRDDHFQVTRDGSVESVVRY